MKSIKSLLVYCLFSFAHLWADEIPAQSSTPAPSLDATTAMEDVAFSHVFAMVEAGEIYPWGFLQDAVDNSVFAGGGIRYTYWNDFDGFVQMDYAYFKPAMDNEIVYGVHHVNGRLGLSYHSDYLKIMELGAGFLCTWTRADYDESKVKKDSFKKKPGGTLVDNETEFGWFFRLNLPVWNTENYRAGFYGLWDQLWTLPKRSNMISFGFFVERRIW